MSELKSKTHYYWVPTLYLLEGIPYAFLAGVSVIFFKNFGFANTKIAFFTSLFTAPYFFKPLIAPLIEHLASRRTFILGMTFLMTALLLALALSLELNNFFPLSIILFLLLGVTSAIYDLNVDGLYIVTLPPTEQANFIGIRTLSYQIGRIACQSGLVFLASLFFISLGIKESWQIALLTLALFIFIFGIYHSKILPKAQAVTLSATENKVSFKGLVQEFLAIPHLTLIVSFIFLYNLTENQLNKIVPLFLLDKTTSGGLNLATATVGILSGISLSGMLVGVLLASYFLGKKSLKSCLLPITLFASLSNLSYLFLSYFSATHIFIVAALIALAQFGFGLSNGAYMFCLLQKFGRGKYPMSLYAIGTALMGLSMTVGGAMSGYLQYLLGYQGFFLWIALFSAALVLFSYYLVRKEAV